MFGTGKRQKTKLARGLILVFYNNDLWYCIFGLVLKIGEKSKWKKEKYSFIKIKMATSK
jgi:hypothetical protein